VPTSFRSPFLVQGFLTLFWFKNPNLILFSIKKNLSLYFAGDLGKHKHIKNPGKHGNDWIKYTNGYNVQGFFQQKENGLERFL